MFSIPATTGVEFGLGKDAVNVTGSESATRTGHLTTASRSTMSKARRAIRSPSGTTTAGSRAGSRPVSPFTARRRGTRPPRSRKAALRRLGETGEEKDVQVVGRHDPVLPPRAVPVVEAMLYCTVLDFMLLAGRINPDRVDGNPGQYDTDYHPSSPDND